MLPDLGSSFDAALRILERRAAFSFLDHLDHGAQGVSQSGAVILCDRLIDDFQGLVDAPDGEQERRLKR